MHRILLPTAVALLAACASSQSTPPATATRAPSASIVDATAKARIDSTLRAFVTSGKLVGTSAVVWEKGREVYFGGSTLFWVDPANQLTAVLFTQVVPFDPVKLHKGFRDAVYGPIIIPARTSRVVPGAK